MYPLLVACKSISTLRRRAAEDVVEKIRQHHGLLVDQANTIYPDELFRYIIEMELPDVGDEFMVIGATCLTRVN